MTADTDKIGISDVYAFSLWFRSRVGKYFTVQFDASAETAWVKMRPSPVCVIPKPNTNMTKRDVVRLRGFGIHESGHPRFQPEIFKLMDDRPIKNGSPIAGIWNGFLDVHSETLSYREYPGDGKALSEFAAVAGRDVYERLSKLYLANGSVWPHNFAKMASVMTACRNAEKTWNIGMDLGFAKVINDLYTPDIRDVAATLEKKFDLTHRLVDKGEDENGETLLDLSIDVFKYLWPEEDPEEHMPPPPGKGKKKGEEEEGEGGEQPTGAGGENKEHEKGNLIEEMATEKIKVHEIMHSDHYDTEAGGGHGMGFDYTNYKRSAVWTPVDPSQFRVVEWN